MNETIIVSIVGSLTTIIGSFFSYRQGRKKTDNEATRVAFESYKFALESLRSEFERQIDSLKKENQELRERIKVLESKK